MPSLVSRGKLHDRILLGHAKPSRSPDAHRSVRFELKEIAVGQRPLADLAHGARSIAMCA
jgi:hypothetical protein